MTPSPSERLIIYSDLDGTFLDHHTYSYAESLSAFKAATKKDIPVVFCSSKTRAEMEDIRQSISVRDPFIVENGAAVYVPKGYFPFSRMGSLRRGEFEVIELGTSYRKLLKTLKLLKRGFPGHIVGFNDMDDEQVATECGLTLAEASRAKSREYDEAFKIIDAKPNLVQTILQKIEENGLQYTIGGRYYHLLGANDKGRAVGILKELFTKAYGSTYTVGLGDSLNDLSMLTAVELPILVKKADGTYDQAVVERLPHVRLAKGVGPGGWGTAIMEILAKTD
jgi:mannosyl-3-phosphoglycerate phosphatase